MPRFSVLLHHCDLSRLQRAVHAPSLAFLYPLHRDAADLPTLWATLSLGGADVLFPPLPTPLGEDAKTWAQGFFDGVSSVKLERDHPGEIRDYYGRYLAYDGPHGITCTFGGAMPYWATTSSFTH